jgi:hypothetical protein
MLPQESKSHRSDTLRTQDPGTPPMVSRNFLLNYEIVLSTTKFDTTWTEFTR